MQPLCNMGHLALTMSSRLCDCCLPACMQSRAGGLTQKTVLKSRTVHYKLRSGTLRCTRDMFVFVWKCVSSIYEAPLIQRRERKTLRCYIEMTHMHTHTHLQKGLGAIFVGVNGEQYFLSWSHSLSSVFCFMWSKKWVLPFDVLSDPVCFPLRSPLWGFIMSC